MRVFVLGDLHLPWGLWPLLVAASRFCQWYKPDIVIQVGDFIDAHSWSKYAKAPDSPGAALEWAMARASAKRLHGSFPPGLQWHILEGNHDRRLMMRAMDVQLPGEMIRPLSELFPYPNWRWHVHAKPFVVDGVAYIHGDEVAGRGVQIARAVGKPTVHGHHHSLAAIDYSDTFDRQLWTMNVGCAMDQLSIAARYARKSIVRSWVGWGTVTNGIPHLYPWALLKNRNKTYDCH